MPPTADVHESPMGFDPGWALLAAVVAAGFVGRLAYGFEWDELQVLHGAWAVGHGAVPFRDFFEHHSPLLQLLAAPLVAGATDVSLPLLVGVRLVVLAVLAVVALGFHRLVVRTGTTGAGAWSAIALVVVVPVSGKLFELRADWFALAAVLAALCLLVRADARASAGDAWLAGILWGVAAAFTQKALLLWVAALAWCVAPIFRREVRAVARLAGGFAIGAATPLALLAAGFALAGGLGELVVGMIGVNLGWPQEIAWQHAWAQSNPGLAGPLVLAGLAAARALVARGGGAAARAESLVGVVWVAGVVAYLTTPVPWEQSLVFFVAPWTACLCLRALQVAGRMDVKARLRAALVWLAGIVAVALTLPAPKRVYVVAVWAALAVVVTLAGRLRTAACALLLPALVLFARGRMDELRSGRVQAQLAFARETAALCPAWEPVLTLWDHVLPFRPAASYHWFVHQGVLERFVDADGTARIIDAELVRALDVGTARVVIADPAGLQFLPRLAARLERRCRLAVPGYAGSDAYECERRAG